MSEFVGALYIAALTLQRFRGADGSVFVTTDTYFKSNAKDNTKYLFQGNTYGKGKLVLAIIKHHVEINPKISFSALEKDFPQKSQGSNGVFATIEEARKKADTDRKRHFIKPNEEIKLLDTTIAVCSQWGIGNINNFIGIAKEKGYIIEAKKG